MLHQKILFHYERLLKVQINRHSYSMALFLILLSLFLLILFLILGQGHERISGNILVVVMLDLIADTFLVVVIFEVWVVVVIDHV